MPLRSSAKLFLMVGYPGAGKTTTAAIVAEITGAVQLSSDALRFAMFPKPSFSQAEHDTVYRTLDYVAELLLQRGVSVIYDANLNRHQHRKEKYEICERTQATPVLLWLQTPRPLAKERAVHESRSHFAPKDDTLEQMFERITTVFEDPTPEENPVPLDGTHVTADSMRALLGEHHLL